MDTVSSYRTEEQFPQLFKNASENAEASGISIPTIPPGQNRQRKVPAKYAHSSTATESHCFKTVEEYFRVKVFYPFLDILSQELHRRFKGDGKTQTFKVVSALHSLPKLATGLGKMPWVLTQQKLFTHCVNSMEERKRS